MRVLGLDLSMTATGVAMPDGTLTTLRTHGVVGDWRLGLIRGLIRNYITDKRPELAVIEDLPTHARAAGTTGMVHGAVRIELMDSDVPYLTVPPATLKKYATGRGNAPKPDLRMELYKRTGQDVADDNQVDAAWLRLLGLDLAGTPEIVMPASHRAALTKLTLPAGIEATS